MAEKVWIINDSVPVSIAMQFETPAAPPPTLAQNKLIQPGFFGPKQ